jgi:hypothetical protein
MQELHKSDSAALKHAKLQELLKECPEKLWHPSFYAAYLQDPINFVTCADGSWTPLFAKLTEQQLEEACQCILDLTADASSQTLDERNSFSRWLP